MPCPRCHARIPARAKFCPECGSPLTGSAPLPGPASQVLPDSLRRLMPDEIVRKMAGSRGRVEGERRVVTILFCDVRGSTAMADSLDPEDVMEIMNGAFEEMIAPVIRYGGTLARLMGDAILAFFGAPVAHEDDPERACRAALDIQSGMARYAEKLLGERGIRDFTVRVGINTGTVVVGEVGNSERVEYTAMGDAVNLAARMESTADPGTIRISENTMKLVGETVETVPLGEVEVRGKSRPVPVYRVTGLRKKRSAPRTAGGVRETPMVGRERESAIIRDAIAGLQGGRGTILAVTGEAGVGKSRLVSEAAGSAPAGVTWVRTRAVPYTAGSGYAMLGSLVRSAIGIAADAPETTIRDALSRTVSRYAPERRDEIIPFLSWLLHIPAAGADAARVKKLDAESFGHRIGESVMGLLSGMAAAGPLALWWEDLHWADPSSLASLRHLLGLARTHPVGFLLVSRPEKGDLVEFYSGAAERFSGEFSMIELSPLGRNESARMITHMLGGKKITAVVRREILKKTEGNAFFLEEVVRSIVEDPTPSGAAGKKTGPRSGPSPFRVPETVQGVVTARLDRLPEEHRRVLRTASVIGRNFRTSVVAATVGNSGEGPASDRIPGLLVELEKREFIDRRSGARARDPEYSFRHGITQDVVYGTMLIGQRKALHRGVGEAIERVFPAKTDELAPALALHFEKAEVYDKALGYTLRAAETARLSYANREAVICYRRALRFIERHGTDAGKLSEIHERLGDVFAVMARYDESVSHYTSALAAGEYSGGNATAVLRRKMGGVFERWGRYDEADRELRLALAGLDPVTDAVESALVNIGLARVLFRRDEVGPASVLAANALAVMDGTGDLAGAAEACGILGNLAFKGGDPDAAISYYGRCLGTWEETEYLEGLAMVYNNLGQIHHQREEWDVAVVYYTKSLSISEKTGNRYGTARTCDNLSQLFAALGRSEEAARYLRQAVDIFREIGKSGDAVIPEMWVQSGTL